ncbi:MAG: twin-arginine translocation signal domain-containing protein, partial [Myxococcales bacterium]
MAPLRRRDFLKASALGVAALAAPSAFSAPKDLKLKKPIKVGCQTILSGPLGGYG